MSFFDQLAGSFNKVTKDLTNKAQEISDTAKLNSRINDANALIKSTYTAIGRAYYEKHREDEEDEFADQFKIIAEAKASVEEYRAEILKLKGMVLCTGCGSEISKDASFCPKCGAKVERLQEETEEEAAGEEEAQGKTCGVCHEPLEDDAQFCANCGAPVEQAEPEKSETEDEA